MPLGSCVGSANNLAPWHPTGHNKTGKLPEIIFQLVTRNKKRGITQKLVFKVMKIKDQG